MVLHYARLTSVDYLRIPYAQQRRPYADCGEAMELAIEATAVRKSYGDGPSAQGSRRRLSRAGRCSRCSDPNGAGKTTMVRILATLTVADGGRASVAGFDVVGQRRQVRRRISLTGQFAAVDGLQTGEENLRMMGRLRRPVRAGRRASGRPSCWRARPARRRSAAGGHLLRWHAPPPRPGRRPGRAARGDLPRRADDRPRPAQPAGRVDAGRRAGRPRRDGVPHHAVPRRGRPSRRPHRRRSTPAGSSPRARRPSSSTTSPSSGSSSRCADADAFDHDRRASGGTGGAHRSASGAPSSVATDGSAAHVRALLDKVDPGARPHPLVRTCTPRRSTTSSSR